MKKLLSALFIIYISAGHPAYAVEVEWAKTYDGPGQDAVRSMQQTSDGGYVIAGYTDPGDAGSAAWLIKTDAYGNALWDKKFGSSGWSWFDSVQQTSDGGYLMAGGIDSSGLSENTRITKTDSNGDGVWNKTLDAYVANIYNTAQETSDGGYMVTSSAFSSETMTSQSWLIKTDSLGNEIWNKNFNNNDEIFSAQQTSDGGYVVAGGTLSSDDKWEAWIAKTDADGGLLWNKAFAGYPEGFAYSVQETADGGYVLAGSSYLLNDLSDAWLIKTDPNGNIVWDKTFSFSDYDWLNSVQQTTDGGYIMAGYTGGQTSGDAWLIKTDLNGNLLWDAKFGGSGTDLASSVCQTFDGGFAFAGFTDSFGAGDYDAWLVKVRSESPVVPEPATLLLFSIGGIAATYIKRKKCAK